jgi:hypothetical protein
MGWDASRKSRLTESSSRLLSVGGFAVRFLSTMADGLEGEVEKTRPSSLSAWLRRPGGVLDGGEVGRAR